MRVVALDALNAAHIAAARALCTTGRAAELLERAISGTPECRARVAITTDGGTTGIALHGLVAGALGTAALLWVGVAPGLRRRGIGRALLADALGAARDAGARLIVAEVAAEPASGPVFALLRRCGFEREGEIADFYRDGVALTLWRRSLD